jgi:damage-control phosphatase, subfamily III
MSHRLPVIVTQIIDQLARDKDEITESFGADAKDEPKVVAGKLSKLKYEIQTSKNFTPITGDKGDVASWNQFIEELEKDDANSFFSAVWLYAECYIYRRINAIFEES